MAPTDPVRVIGWNEVSVKNDRHIAVIADMTQAAWNTVATHEVFIVTGMVRLRMWIENPVALASTLLGASVQFGRAGATDAIFGAVAEANFGGGGFHNIDDGAVTVLADCSDALWSGAMDSLVYGVDIGYEITGEALIAGSLIFHCVWEPLSDGARVTPGDGGTL